MSIEAKRPLYRPWTILLIGAESLFNERVMPIRSNSETLITVYGGSGFLGRHVVRALAKRDYRIRVAVRRPELAGHLQPLGRVGQIHAVQANIRNGQRSASYHDHPNLGRARRHISPADVRLHRCRKG